MGLLDLNREIVTEFKADISDHKAKIRELDGAEKELAEAELQRAEARNEQMDSWLEKVGKVSLALFAIKEVGSIVFEGYKEGIHEAKLETAAMGVNIEALGAAAGGLKTKLELLEFAAKANASAFHNSQDDMEVAERAIRKLEARGVPAAEAVEAITNAVVSAKTRGLVPLGIVVDTHIEKLKGMDEANMSAAQKTELHAAAMKSLREFTEDASDSQDNLGDSMGRTQVNMANSWAELKISLGELATAFGPILNFLSLAIQGFADLAGRIFEAMPTQAQAEYMLKHPGGPSAGHEPTAAERAAKLKALTGLDGSEAPMDKAKYNAILAKEHEEDRKEQERVDAKAAAAALRMQERMNAYFKRLTEIEEATRLHIQKMKELDSNVGHAGTSTQFGGSAGGTSVSGGPGGFSLNADPNADYEVGGFSETIDKNERARVKGLTDDWNKRLKTGEERKSSFLEKSFGKVEEFAVYKDLFSGLTGAVTSGYTAMVTGSMSFGQAFKQSVGQLLLAEGSKMQVLALQNTAYGIAALALGPIGGTSAAQYFGAAAMFEAGAIAAGVAASALGAGGSAGASKGGGASPGAPSSLPPGSGAGAANQNAGPTIVYGDSFSDDSPRMRQVKAKKLVSLALGNDAGEHS